MELQTVLKWSLIILLLFAIAGTIPLVMAELRQGNICPKILTIPACYIVLICFLLGFIFSFDSFSKANILFFLSIGIVSLMALTGTLGEIIGFAKCPRTSSGIPMCFISLGICLTSILLKAILIRNTLME